MFSLGNLPYGIKRILNGGVDLEPYYCKKWQKSPEQEFVSGNRGRLKVLNDTKLILNAHLEPIGIVNISEALCN